MPRPVRELWSSLGAQPGEGDDLLVVGADALSLDSLFGGALAGDVVVRLFSDEAFGFAGPEELAALGVFWAPHLENTKQLRAAVLDAQDRLRRKLEEESERLGQLGLRARLEGPDPRTRAHADIGGLALDVVVGTGGELLLERVDGGEVPAAEQEVLKELAGASREQVQDTLAAHAHRLVEAGLVAPAPAAAHDDDDDGFEDNPQTAQLVAPSLNGGDPGTLLVPPPSDDGEPAADDEAGAAELAAALDEDDLADSLEGPAVEEDEPAAAPGDLDDEEPEERTLGAGRLDLETAQTAQGLDDLDDAAAAVDASAPDGAEDDVAQANQGDDDGGDAAPEDDEGFVRPKTAPTMSQHTQPPASFAEYPALPTQQISMVAPDEPGAEEEGISALASGFDEETGEERAVLSLSGDDGVMPSPAEATQLRPAPTSAELDLDDDDDPLDTPPHGRPPVSAADGAAGDDEADDDENTVARAPVFRTGHKGPSLVSSGSAGSSVDERRSSAEDDDDGEPASAAPAIADDEADDDEVAGDEVAGDEVAGPEVADEEVAAEAVGFDDGDAPADPAPAQESGALVEDADMPTALHGFTPPASDSDEPEAADDGMERLEAEPTDPSLGVVRRAEDEAPLDLPSSLEVELDDDDHHHDDEDDEDGAKGGHDEAVAALPSEEAAGVELESSGFETGEFPKSARELATATALAELAGVGDDDEDAEPTQAGVSLAASASQGGPSGERLDALAAIVGEGMSSGKTGAIVLDADAFAYLRAASDEPAALAEDPDALEREAELLELKARELRAKAELLRERATAPVARRTLASALEKARAARAEEELRAAEASAESVPSDEAAAFASEEGGASDDGFAAAPVTGPDPSDEGADAAEGDAASAVDAFADGVALEEVRAMLAAEEAGGDVYAATQLAEMDLGELRQPSLSGGVFESGGDDDDDDDDEQPAYALVDHTGRGRALGTSMASLPQAASADVQVLESMAERASEPRFPDEKRASKAAASAASAKAPPAARALALVVSDPRARERLKKHLEETFPRVVELASPREAVSLSAREVQAVVIVRPTHDDATVSGLEALQGSRARPPVLVLSSDASFDGLPGVDLRLELGRRASEVARQVLEGLSTLGVRASA